MKKNIIFFQGTAFRDFCIFLNVRMDKNMDLSMTSPSLFKSQSFSKRRTYLFAKLTKTPQLFMNSVFRQGKNCFLNQKKRIIYELVFFNAPNRL
jgi:hypothetical protein